MKRKGTTEQKTNKYSTPHNMVDDTYIRSRSQRLALFSEQQCIDQPKIIIIIITLARNIKEEFLADLLIRLLSFVLLIRPISYLFV
jgi:hypothetical protein